MPPSNKSASAKPKKPVPAKRKKHGATTGSAAAKILIKKNIGFVVPTANQKRKLLIAFARKNKVLYGRAYDLIRVAGSDPFDLNDEKDIEDQLDRITIYEIKSTKRKLNSEFKGYFFALTTAELLVAQNLKEKYRFIFVNTSTKHTLEKTLQEVMQSATGFYPQWSITF